MKVKKMRKLNLNRETLCALAPESLAEARGGLTEFCTYTCYCGNTVTCSASPGCAGSNNSCGNCHEN